MPMQELSIAELLMLLALDDDNGRVRWSVSPYLDYALAGGLLAELAMRGVINVTSSGDLQVSQDRPTEWALLDDVIARFRQSDHPHTVSGWVTSVSAIPELANRIMDGLVAKGVLAHQEGHFLWIFHTSRYPTVDARPEKQLNEAIRGAILRGEPTTQRLAVIIAIAHGAHLLKGPLTDEEIENNRDRINEIARGEAISEATCGLIQEAERALYVASSIPFMAIGRF